MHFCRTGVVLLVSLAGAGAAIQPVSPAMAFEPNRGQAPAGVEFLARGSRGTLLLGRRSAVLQLAGGSRIVLTPARANPSPRIIGERRGDGVSNYLRGND